MSNFWHSVFSAAANATAARDAGDDFWFTDAGALGAAPAGMSVTAQSILQLPAVVDCLNTITQPLASLPLVIFRRGADGSKLRLPDHPVARALTRQPNGFQTAYEFRAQMQWNLGLYRRAYAEIVPGPGGFLGALKPLHPSSVTARSMSSGELYYDVRENGLERKLRSDQVWHLKALPFTEDGVDGCSVMETSRNTLSAALAAQDYADRFFANDTKSGGIISLEHNFKDKESRDNFLKAWRKARGGVNRHKDAILEYGAKYQRTAQTNEEAQFLETRKEGDLAIARIWQVPPHKIGILDKATFSNIEQQAIEFVVDTMLPWLCLWEQKIETDFLSVFGDDLGCEFNILGLLRGDTKTRYEAYALGRQWGWLSVNDIRKLENQDPITGGDTYMEPLNMAPAGSQEKSGMAESGKPPRPNGRDRGATTTLETTH